MAKRLEDLYVLGVDFEIDDGSGEPVRVWIQKPDPVQHDAIILAAASQQAVVMSSERTQDNEWLGALAEVVMIDRQLLIDELVYLKEAERRPAAASRVAFDEERDWKVLKSGTDQTTWTYNYLEGLQTAWEESLKARFEQNPEDSEAKRVKGELDRFEAEVAEELMSEINPHRRDMENQSLEFLQDEVTRQRLKMHALMKWHREHTDQTLFYAVREPDDHSKMYFDSIDQTRRVAREVKNALMGRYNEITMDSVQGKGSPGAAGSSASSAPAAPEETNSSSGPEIVAA